MKDILKYHAVSPIIGVLLLLAITVLLYTGLSLIGFSVVDINGSSKDQINTIDHVEITADGRITIKEDLDGATVVWESANGSTGNLTTVGDTVQVDELRIVYAVTNGDRTVIYSANDNNLEFDNPPDPGESKGEGSISDGNLPGDAGNKSSNKSDIQLVDVSISVADTAGNSGNIKSVDIFGEVDSADREITVQFNGGREFTQEVNSDNKFEKDGHELDGGKTTVQVEITIADTTQDRELVCTSNENLTEDRDLDEVSYFDCE